MEETGSNNHVVGTKQTGKALEKGRVKVLYLARDAEHSIVSRLETAAREKKVMVVWVSTMKELGKNLGIETGAASAALLEE